MVVSSVYVAPDTALSELQKFADNLALTLQRKLECSICVLARDFNRSDTTFIYAMGLANSVKFPTGPEAHLDLAFTNKLEVFSTQRRVLLGNSDHCPRLYSKANYVALTKDHPEL